MEFSRKYHEETFPESYASKHESSLARRLNDRREQLLLRRCLEVVDSASAEGPGSLIDVGCGPGRFWTTLVRCGAGSLAALDVSHAMLRFARERHGAGLAGSFRLTAGSVTALPFADRAFDTVVCLRLLHHFGDPGLRRQALAELARIARRHLVLSLWTDGNFKAWRRRRLEAQRGRSGARSYQNRHVVARDVLAQEFASVGLAERCHFDLVPGYSQWRYYVLERS